MEFDDYVDASLLRIIGNFSISRHVCAQSSIDPRRWDAVDVVLVGGHEMGCAQGPSESVGAERGSLHVLFLFLLLFLAHETAWTDSDEFAREQGVVVGNATMNTTVSPSEHISAQRVDVSVLIGGYVTLWPRLV